MQLNNKYTARALNRSVEVDLINKIKDSHDELVMINNILVNQAQF